MSFNLPGEANPFEAPRAGIGKDVIYQDFADNDAELIRREHIGRESNIKSLGHLSYLFAFFAALGTIIAICMVADIYPTPPNQAPGVDPVTLRIGMGIAAAFYLGLTLLCGALGYGLTHLQVWARWMAVVFSSIGLPGVAFYALVFWVMFSPTAGLVVLVIGGGFLGSVLFLLLSGKSGTVFSSEYKGIILKTPYVKLKTSLLVKILLVLILLAIVGAVLAAIFGNRS